MTPDEIRRELRREIDKAGGVTQWAAINKIPRTIVSGALNGAPDKAVPKKVAVALGFVGVVNYAPLKPKFNSALMSLRDCTNPDVRKDAEDDLRRAIDRHEAFAVKWGEALILGYDDHGPQGELYEELARETNELEASSTARGIAIQTAVKSLDAFGDTLPTDALKNTLADIITPLEQALDE